MPELNESVIMPREDFIELSTVAFDNSHVPSASERVANVLQTTFIFGGVAGAVAAGTWGWAKAIDWLEERRTKRFVAKYNLEHPQNPNMQR
jgi:hypothetical protein